MGPPWIEVACSKAGWFTSSSFHAHQEHMTSPDNANVKGMNLWMELRPLLLDVKLYTSQRCLLLLQHLWPTPETMNRCRPMPKSRSGVNNMLLASWRYFTVCLVYPFNLLICLKGVRSHLAFLQVIFIKMTQTVWTLGNFHPKSSCSDQTHSNKTTQTAESRWSSESSCKSPFQMI